MPSIKEIAKAAKSEIKASKEDKNITLENVKKIRNFFMDKFKKALNEISNKINKTNGWIY